MAVRERYEQGRLRYVPVGIVENGDGQRLVYPVDKGSGATTSLTAADGVVPMDPDTNELAAGQAVEVQLFSPSVQVPTLVGAGEDDPALSRLLDAVDRPRYLGDGSAAGLRRLRDGITDIAVVSGPTERPGDATVLGEWTREWGLVVPEGNPDDVEGLDALVDGDISLVNRPTDSGLRGTFDAALDALAESRDTDRAQLADAIHGYERAARAHESPTRIVARDEADAGLGLRASADALGLGFVSLGQERVTVLAASDRTGKAGVEQLRDALADGNVFDSLAGYEPVE
jgi:molybdate-binding protein